MINFIKRSKYKDRVLLLGFPELNLGDDLFFKIVIERYPQSLFVFIGFEEYKEIFKAYNNVVVINKGNLIYRIISRLTYFYESRTYYVPPSPIIRLLHSIYSFTHTILIGGSIFQEHCDNNKGLDSLNSFRKMRRILKNCSFAIIGCNFGPYETLDYCENIKEIFKLMDDVCMRDRISYELFKQLDNIRYSNDVVLHMSPEVSSVHDNYITISIIKPSEELNIDNIVDRYINKIIEYILYYNRKGLKVVLMSFCKSLGDEIVLGQIRRKLSIMKYNVDYFFYDGNTEEALTIISKSQLMIGTRFHSVILSFIYNIPVIPVAYSNKTKDMLSNYGIWHDDFYIGNFINLPVEKLEQQTLYGVNINKNDNKQFEFLDISLK